MSVRFFEEPPARGLRIDSLQWLVGVWEAEIWGGIFEESWLPPRANEMESLGRFVRDDQIIMTEFQNLQETPGGGLVLRLQIAYKHEKKTDRASFKGLISESELRLTRDGEVFPQSITYRKTGEPGVLHCELKGLQDGKPHEELFVFKRR